MDFGQVKFIKPQKPELEKLIKGYYVHKSGEADFYAKVTFYQNITTTISIYHDSVTTANGRQRQQHHQKNAGFNSLLVGQVDKYQEVEFFGPLDRLAIVFYPGGLNHFIEQPLSELLAKHFSDFSYFGTDYDQMLSTVYGESDIEKKREALDDFFMEHLHQFNEPELLRAMDRLIYSTEPIRVEELASEIGLSRRTLLRKFKKHLGYSLEAYQAVIKFRRALFSFQERGHVKNLSDVALESNYYDQADFNHNLKSLSGLTPKQLFEQLEIVDDVLFWRL